MMNKVALLCALLAVSLAGSCKKDGGAKKAAPPSNKAASPPSHKAASSPSHKAAPVTTYSSKHPAADDKRPCSEVQCGLACEMEGRCTPKGDLCVAGSDEDCKRGEVCRFLGKCKAAKEGVCVWGAVSGAGCRAGADPCVEWGLCTVSEGACVASSDKDCAASNHCTKYGRCKARDGRCVVSVSEHWSCEAARGPTSMEPCREHGQCSAREGLCVAATDGDCKRSEACKDNGKCKATEAGGCAADSDASCKASDRCDGRGECSAVGGWCVARSAAGCVLAPACKEGLTEGWCYSGHDDEDCRDGAQCGDWGRCSYKDGWCVAASDEDCKLSTTCRTRQRCKAKDGWCVK
jgi:hypothetical protein